MAWKNVDESLNGKISIAGVSYKIKDGVVAEDVSGEAAAYFINHSRWNKVELEVAPKKAPAPKKKAAAKKKA